LVPTFDSGELAQAIHRLDSDPKMLSDLSEQNWEMRTNYAASKVIPDILHLMDIKV